MKYFTSLFLILLLTTCGVQQKLSISYKLRPGMTQTEVETIMGAPIKSDFKQIV